MNLPVYRSLHGTLDQLASACDRIDTTHRVSRATAPSPCRRHRACYRLRLIAFPIHRKEATT
jgi:hypothetical protein